MRRLASPQRGRHPSRPGRTRFLSGGEPPFCGRFLASAVRKLFQNDEARYIAVRYASALLVALEGLFYARLLGPEGYGIYALVQQIAVLLALSALGHPAGFIYAYFRGRSGGGPESIARYYPACALMQYLGGVVIAAAAGFWYPAAIAAACYYAIQIPNLIVEPILRVKGRYALSGAGRGSAALGALLAGACFTAGYGARASTAQAIPLMIGGSALGYASFYFLVAKLDRWPFTPAAVLRTVTNPAYWKRFASEILRPGVPLNASSALLTTQNNLPRFFLERFHPPAALGVFSLAWQLSQGAMVLLTSLNAVSSVEIGKRMEQDSAAAVFMELRRQFLKTLAAAGASFAMLLALSWILSQTVYRDYPNLVLVCLLVNAGYLMLNITGSVTAYLFYERRTVILNTGYAVAVLASAGACWITGRAGLWYGYQIAAVSAILIVLNLTFLGIIYRLASEHKRSGSTPAAQPPEPAEAALV